MMVHVIMSNDYPDCVFSDVQQASRYCATKNDEDKVQAKRDGRRRIFYSTYTFLVNK